MPERSKLTLEEATPAILIACYECHHDGRPLPSYAEIGAIGGYGEEWGRNAMGTLLSYGLLTGTTGRKPTGLSESGKAAALRYMTPATSGDVVVSTAVAARSPLVDELSNRWGIDSGRMFDLVSKTMITKGRDEGPPTKEEVAVVMHVMRQYDLDPLLRQLHAFTSKGKLQVMLGYDGWVREVNKHRANGLMGITFAESPETIEVPGTKLKVPEWIEATAVWTEMARRLPTSYRAYFAEWFVPGDQWRTRPYHRLRMKAYCQCAREALGIGLADEVDRDQFDWQDNPAARMQEATAARTGAVTDRLKAFTAEYEVAEEDVVVPDDSSQAYGGAEDASPCDETPEPSSPQEGAQEPTDLDLDAALLREQIEKGELN